MNIFPVFAKIFMMKSCKVIFMILFAKYRKMEITVLIHVLWRRGNVSEILLEIQILRSKSIENVLQKLCYQRNGNLRQPKSVRRTAKVCSFVSFGLRHPKSVRKTAIYGSFVGLKKVSVKLPYMAVLSAQKCVRRTAIYGSSMDTLQNCRIWQLCPSGKGEANQLKS